MLPENTLAGIDYCEHAAGGTLPSWSTIRDCPICARRWWIAEARHGGWPPLSREEALATALVADGGATPTPTARRFYAYLATAPADEADFAAAVAAARGTQERLAPPGDFGWRALFADQGDAEPAPTFTTLTRVWEWQGLGTTAAIEGRTFVAGEAIPPFSPPLAGAQRPGGWLREGASQTPPILQQSLGPLLLTVVAEPPDTMATVTLRLRDRAQGETVPTRLYLGAGVARRMAWRGTLAATAQEQQIRIDRDDLAALVVEIDTAW
jgi:hypothetical protein